MDLTHPLPASIDNVGIVNRTHGTLWLCASVPSSSDLYVAPYDTVGEVGSTLDVPRFEFNQKDFVYLFSRLSITMSYLPTYLPTYLVRYGGYCVCRTYFMVRHGIVSYHA